MDKEIWITFAEAIFRMSSKLLFILDFQAKPLLRDVVAAKRVSGRGELRERGRLIFSLNDKGLDSDPNVIRAPGGFYYEAESYPAEVRFDEFSAWIDELAASDRDAFFPSSQIANPKPVSTHQIEVRPNAEATQDLSFAEAGEGTAVSQSAFPWWSARPFKVD